MQLRQQGRSNKQMIAASSSAGRWGELPGGNAKKLFASPECKVLPRRLHQLGRRAHARQQRAAAGEQHGANHKAAGNCQREGVAERALRCRPPRFECFGVQAGRF